MLGWAGSAKDSPARIGIRGPGTCRAARGSWRWSPTWARWYVGPGVASSAIRRWARDRPRPVPHV
eukprot:10171826-Alexandrium_andersonii.AAC.1